MHPHDIVIAAGDTIRIADPVAVRVQSANGVDQAVEIEQADGTVTRLAFRSPIAPELVDGIAP